MPDLPFFSPDLTDAEQDAVAAVLRSGWITTGPATADFERALCTFCGANHAVCFSSQTMAAELLLRALGIGPGDEVLLPAYTYTATCAAVCHVGAAPILIDCAPGEFTMDPNRIEAALTPRTRAVIAVDFAGIPCDYQALTAIAEAAASRFSPASPLQEALGRIAVIADASHSLGAKRGGVPSGALADFTCFSFHAVKNVTTAEGGAVVWRDPAGRFPGLERQLRLLSLHGQTRTALEKESGGWEYDVLFPGYKCNMTDLCAALGLAQLARYPAMLARRRELIARYDASLAPLPVAVCQHFSAEICSSGHLYPMRLTGWEEEQRNRLFAAMLSRGVRCNVHYKPLPLLTAYRALGFSIADFPAAFAMYQNELTLPLGSAMTGEQVDQVVQALTASVLALGTS